MEYQKSSSPQPSATSSFESESIQSDYIRGVEQKAQEGLLFRRAGEPAYDVPFAYVYHPDEPKDVKEQKYTYRQRDLYVSQANNRIVLLPDWRVRSDDRLPRLDFFTGDLRIKKKS